eukprot:TRINITY_DN417_c0_g1_i1.p1 TRINITY_DN417_c0_g1~~TRINITY_DN417_c0_g1_i1.p1  ORF type:complete len:613 (+),score=109.59 TRINITY_DN417_c0_g1_i1:63-1901(+)
MGTNLVFFPLPSSTVFLLHNKIRSPNYYSSSRRSNFSSISICRTPSISASAVEFAATTPDTYDVHRRRRRDADVDVDLLDISKLGISEEIVSSLFRRGITNLFPIQRAVLEPAMEGRDMIGRAITGSGKTLAFGIPILDNIIRHHSCNRKKRAPSALVLAPTRELARQVQKEFKESAPNLSSACLYGGIPIINQVRMLGFGIDIAVGTPGRIIDLVERGALNLSEVKFVVLDEADQMLAIGFQEAVECILSYLPAKKQCMLFSATMPLWVNQLSRKYLRDPLVIDLVGNSDKKLADGISLYSVASTSSGKQNILPTLISRYGQGGKSIIFTKTKRDAETLSRSVGSILASKALHGNMQQFHRDKTLAAFRDGRFNVLVATDVAARGLDIPNVDLVIHFELPNTSEIFVHRSGRTGRAGKKGNAVLIFTEAQRRSVKVIERDLGFKFEELPRITDGVGNRTGIMDVERSPYGRYDDSRQHFGNPDHHFGNHGRSRGINYGNSNETRVHSNAFKHIDDGGNERSRGNHFSRIVGARNARSAKFKKSQLHIYDDFESNYFTKKNNFASDLNNSGRNLRFTTPKYESETESFATDERFDIDHLIGKKRPTTDRFWK